MTAIPPEALVAELKTARRGRGLYHPDIAARIGPGLRLACGIGETDSTAAIRSKAISRLRDAAGTLPGELSVAALAALGIHPEVRDLPQLQDRVDWLAERLRRDVRTARRRVDEACALLAESAAAGRTAVRAGRPPGGWHVESCHAAVLLDGEAPSSLERRVVVAEHDGIDQLVLGWSVPRAGEGGHDLHAQVLYGGLLATKERDTATRFRLVLELPVTLRGGERHEYAIQWRIPPDQPMRPHYVYVPANRCDYFDLHVRFDRRKLPDRVWRVTDSFHRDLDENAPDADAVPVDRAGEVHVEFDDLMPGHGYGIRWG